MASAMFMNVAATDGEVSFGAMTPIMNDGSKASPYTIEIQYLNPDGSTDFTNDYFWDGEGWLDYNFSPANDVVIPGGKGFWVGNNAGNASIQSSGEVNQKDVLYTLNVGGSTAAANCFPCKTTFGRIIPLVGDEMAPAYTIEIQYLNPDGSTDFSNDFFWDGEGWLDSGFMPANETEIASGKGFWVGNNAGMATLRIVAPEL